MPEQILLTILTPKFSSVAPILYRSGHFRSARLRRYFNTPLLAGLNRLLERLDLAAEAYEMDDRLRPAAQLVRRARSDFEAAIVSSFSALSFVCRDQMRDVMEIEYLLRDFRYDLARLDQWAAADEKDEKNLFPSRVLREREAKRRGLDDPKHLIDSLDYSLHSSSIHVTKRSHRSVERGVETDRGPAGVFHGDEDMWEMFIHAGRLLEQTAGLYEAAGLSAPEAPNDDAFNVAWRLCEKTQRESIEAIEKAVKARSEAAAKDVGSDPGRGVEPNP